MGKIAVIGSNMVDLVTYIDRMPKTGETLEAPQFDMGFGGKGANQAVAAARLGADVMMVTKVGDDMFGPATRQNLADNGVDVQYVESQPGTSSGVAPIFVDPSSNNSILIIKGANLHLTPADVDRALPALRQCSLIVMQLEIALDTVYHVIELGEKEGIPVLLNPAPAVSGLDMEKIRKLTLFVPNETELEIVTGMPVTTVDQIQTAAQSLVDQGIQAVMVTMGEKGSLLVTRDNIHQVPCPNISAKDTTGAGDAYIGCFARYYVEIQDLHESMAQASAYASMSTMKPGTQKSYADADGFAAFKKDLAGEK
ncbi:MAG: ribokinase [Desulfobacter sp.]